MDGTRVSERIDRVRAALVSTAADWLLVPASPDFRWLTGGRARSTERLIALAIPATGGVFAIVPALEAEALAHDCPWLDLEVWREHDDPFAHLERRMNFAARPTVLVGEGMRVAAVLRLAELVRCRPAAEVIAPLRACKDAEELAAHERAAAHADAIMEDVADHLEHGMTEREVALAITERFEAKGDDNAWAIVASGPNSALPHHFTSDRRLRPNEVVLLDLGAFTHGYASDITRTFWLGAPPADFRAVFDVVNEARAAGIAASCSGVVAEDVDRASRAVIDRAGYGEYFIHRTGHGAGLEAHEPPYLVAGNRELLRAGMVHSVEPGIYLPGRYGVRIEDLVVVEARGARRLNQAPIHPLPRRMRG